MVKSEDNNGLKGALKKKKDLPELFSLSCAEVLATARSQAVFPEPPRGGPSAKLHRISGLYRVSPTPTLLAEPVPYFAAVLLLVSPVKLPLAR